MQKLEKRVSPRQSLQIPLRFRIMEVASPEPELASEPRTYPAPACS